jgi:hypothetical protein
MARRWIIQYLDTSSTIDIFMGIGAFNIDQVYDDPWYWYTLEPLIVLERPAFDILFVLHYHRNSAVNGGYMNLIAMRYTKEGYLLSAKEIGSYGYYTTVDNKMDDNVSYGSRIYDIRSLVVHLKSLDRITVINKEIHEVDMTSVWPIDTSYISRTETMSKTSVMSID